MTGASTFEPPLAPNNFFVPDTPTPPERPLGIVRGLLGTIQNPLKVWPKLMYEARYHGVPWLGRTFHYFRMPEHVRSVLHEQNDVFEKSPFQRRLLRPATGDGLLSAVGEHWRFQRRAAAPGFRMDMLKALVPTFSLAAQDTVKRFTDAHDNAPVDVMEAMQRTTLDVIVETILGGRDPSFAYDSVAASVSDYVDALGRPDLLDLFGAPGWVPRPWAEKGRRAASDLKAAAVSAIARRRQSGAKRGDLLDLLLAARDPETGKGLSELELRDNVVTFIGAGHETTALALTYALYLIANAPDVQDRLVEEVRAACGDGDVTADSLEALSFHEQVIKEAMRLYPPVAVIDRIAVRDTQIGDIVVREGDLALTMVWVMHRHKLLWDNPQAFDPDRFSPERSAGRDRHQFIPFGAGPRICIGMKFAYMEAVTILATLVRALRFLPDPTYTLTPNIRITLRPENGMPLYVEARARLGG